LISNNVYFIYHLKHSLFQWNISNQSVKNFYLFYIINSFILYNWYNCNCTVHKTQIGIYGIYIDPDVHFISYNYCMWYICDTYVDFIKLSAKMVKLYSLIEKNSYCDIEFSFLVIFIRLRMENMEFLYFLISIW